MGRDLWGNPFAAASATLQPHFGNYHVPASEGSSVFSTFLCHKCRVCGCRLSMFTEFAAAWQLSCSLSAWLQCVISPSISTSAHCQLNCSLSALLPACRSSSKMSAQHFQLGCKCFSSVATCQCFCNLSSSTQQQNVSMNSI